MKGIVKVCGDISDHLIWAISFGEWGQSRKLGIGAPSATSLLGPLSWLVSVYVLFLSSWGRGKPLEVSGSSQRRCSLRNNLPNSCSVFPPGPLPTHTYTLKLCLEQTPSTIPEHLPALSQAPLLLTVHTQLIGVCSKASTLSVPRTASQRVSTAAHPR